MFLRRKDERGKMRSIQTKFITLIVGCVLLSSMIIGGAGIISVSKAVDTGSAQNMNLICREKAQIMDALLSRIEQSVNTLVVYADSQLESVDSLMNDPEYMEAYTRKLQEVAINAANNTEGALAVYVRYNPEFAPPTSGLFWSKTDSNGRFQELTPTDFSRYSPDDVERVGWYYIPVKTGKPTWMAPYMNQNINVEMISYVVPLYANNTTIGVIGMDIDFSVMKDVVDDVHVYNSGYAYLTDEQAVMMYHHEVPMGTTLSSLSSDLSRVATDLKNSSSLNMLIPYEWNRQDKEMAFCALKNGMRLIVTAPSAEIRESKNVLITQTATASIVIVTLAVLLTVFYTKKLIRPLKELNTAAQKIAEGDLSVNLSPQTKDEVGALTDSFQQTVEHLRKYIDYINSLAYRDALTGVKNKTAYEEAEKRLDLEARTGRSEFAMIVLDINDLKHVNDTFGHDCGDMLIIDSCKLICKTFRRSPVYRVGGDEFVVILESTDYQRYAELIEKFQEAINDYNEYSRPGFQINIAHGCAIYDYESDLTVADVFKRADEAMYKNKAEIKALQKEIKTEI